MQCSLARSVAAFLREDDGPTAIEYSVMLALIIVVCLTAVALVGLQANETFLTVGSSMVTPSP